MAKLEDILETVRDALLTIDQELKRQNDKIDSLISEVSGIRIALVEHHANAEERFEHFRSDIVRIDGRCREVEKRIRVVEGAR